MQIIEVNRNNAEILFHYWNKIGESIPYFYNTTYESFVESLFDDTFEGMTIFKYNKVFISKEDDNVGGVIQYGIPTFHFTEVGKITENVNIGVIRNLYFDKSRNDIGQALLDLSLEFFKENNVEDIYAFYHAMGMSCNGNHGKLHENYSYVGELLCENGFRIEHENIYYVCDMSKKKIQQLDNSRVKVSDIDDNRQKFVLYDENNIALGSAEIRYIDKLTGNKERNTIYLVWIGIDKKVKGKGLGTEFLNHIIDFCKGKGYRYLHTDTAINNETAQRFYIRNGFVNKGVTRSYFTK
ncbi:GNAT family N-acetyltransferase [Tepidimicrobium xylanilyticum]|uniref:Acetyltransferase (GNAT) domain-containing protein n=1 Tax=Tepidimicrobium xylanilyticum TaxID=1123352 RepID=A0A1H2XEI2_9FIRM|nr:GNAT family N-acetyltransferase [Tepidimicrobium xylanilyticum]GMG97476.1 hypothetical protein EN5CB1_23020 [Tepidimicrobium xylanilyticum]SDW91257.1 Acetyltransferase (GNAT) domain-containing protein [Tepidimicrobium xylanilyticum]